MGCSAVVVNNAKTNTEQSTTHALNPNPQTRSEGQRVSTDSASSAANRESLSGLWENDQGWAETLRQLCCYERDRTLCDCRANWAYSSAHSRRSCETCRIRTSPCERALVLETFQPTSLAH